MTKTRQTKEQMLAARAKSQMARTLLPIAYNQAKRLSEQAGVPYEDLIGEAHLALSIAIDKGQWDRPGFYSYVKMCIVGYMKNYLRDRSRSVRLPRTLTLTYLADQRLARTDPSYLPMSEAEKATVLGCTVEHLAEARSSINFHSSSLDYNDKCYDSESEADDPIDFDLVQSVFELGVAQVANVTRQDRAVVSVAFYAELKALIERSKDYHA